MSVWKAAALLGLACLAPACAWAASSASVMVYAAASLRNGLAEVARAFETQRPERIVVSYAGTPALAHQIARGAPADVFISADADWMDYLDEKGLIRSGSRRALLSNRLVLIAPATSGAQLRIEPQFALAAALGNSRLAMADPDTVPAGKYARAALAALGVWNAVAPKIARSDNVRAALALVARGETPFGIVYRSDARAEPRVRIVGEFAAGLHPPVVYPAAIVRDSRAAAAGAFLRFLESAAARAIWTRHGFDVGG